MSAQSPRRSGVGFGRQKDQLCSRNAILRDDDLFSGGCPIDEAREVGFSVVETYRVMSFLLPKKRNSS